MNKALLKFPVKTSEMLPLILYLALCLSALASEPISFGEWSKPENGLKGRLLCGEDTTLYMALDGV